MKLLRTTVSEVAAAMAPLKEIVKSVVEFSVAPPTVAAKAKVFPQLCVSKA